MALRLATAMSTVGPSGADQSIGTVRVPHSAEGSSSHGAHWMPSAPAAAPAGETGKSVASAVLPVFPALFRGAVRSTSGRGECGSAPCAPHAAGQAIS